MDDILVFDRTSIRAELDQFIQYAQTLNAPADLAMAIQAWDTVLSVADSSKVLAQANFHLGCIYREWDELFTAQRFFGQAHQFDADDRLIISARDDLNRYIADNQMATFEEKDRKNSNQIISLFRIATGLKLLQMDKGAQAYPLMKSRTKIYPNAAVAKHLLTDIIITEEEKNAAIAFLEERGWLVNTQHELYAISDSGLYAFYTELAKLHVANEVYDEAADCYEQAYWLDDSSVDVLYYKVICHAKSQTWKVGLATLDRLSDDQLPEDIDPAEYYHAVATICGAAYQSTQDGAMRLRAVEACEAVLATDKKNREIANLLKSLQSDQPAAKPKRKWWRW
ncbi:MAG: hypothetical protein O7E52_29495 [Candidatus Poribacteria bacterium]|nr:hypothetical protein [Candidatus Poribacteria bacterium]